MVASLADIEYRIEVRGLSATGQHAAHAPFQSRDLGCHGIVGGVLQTGVEIPFFLQIEQLRHLVRVVILKCRTLNNRQFNRLTILRLVSSLHTQRGHPKFLVHNP